VATLFRIRVFYDSAEFCPLFLDALTPVLVAALEPVALVSVACDGSGLARPWSVFTLVA
jgi:hypothetical protein